MALYLGNLKISGAGSGGLTQVQLSAIDGAVRERATEVVFANDAVSSYNVAGELTEATRQEWERDADLSVKAVRIGSAVTDIGNYAFRYCSALTDVEIPGSVARIGENAFEYCTSLSSVNLHPGVTSFGNYVFSFCSSLTSIEIPRGVNAIPYRAFYCCYGLKDVRVPDGTYGIGSQAFRECTSLTCMEIPDSVVSVGGAAFYHCSALKDITFGSGLTSIAANDQFTDVNSLSSIKFRGKTQDEADEIMRLVDIPAGCSVSAWNIASKEWVEQRIAQLLASLS